MSTTSFCHTIIENVHHTANILNNIILKLKSMYPNSHFVNCNKHPKLFYCVACASLERNKKKQKKTFSGVKKVSVSHRGSINYVSRGLSNHLANNEDCLYFYESRNLHKCYSTSVVKEESDSSILPKKYTPQEFGRILPSNPHPNNNPSNLDLYGRLNGQVVHNVLIPPINRDAMDANMYQPTIFPRCDGSIDSNSLDINDSSDEADDGNSKRKQPFPSINDREISFRSNRIRRGYNANPRLIAEIKLMNLLIKHKLHLNTFKSIFEWAKEAQGMHGFDFASTSARSRDAIFNEMKTHLNVPPTHFEPKLTNWLPGNLPTQIYVRPFQDALHTLLTNNDLMKEKNISLPNSRDPLSPENFPLISDNTMITELHHGSWWTDSWKQLCKKDEMLVPLIFYMDGISLDVHGRLSLTPLNMTLGIFNTETRKKPEAWTTIYFHPDHQLESIGRNTRKEKPHESIQNLHNALDTALSSLRTTCESNTPIEWDFFPHDGRLTPIKMKFAIAFVIGDTELHDKLCGKYGSRSLLVNKLCRHCNCPSEDINKPNAQTRQERRLWVPYDFQKFFEMEDRTETETYCQSISHHPIKNAFHKLNFGANVHNIHLVSPGECLHMHQLGVAKRCVEALGTLLLGQFQTGECPYASDLRVGKKSYSTVEDLARLYGAQLSRQSDRDFPRTKFTGALLSSTKKGGQEYSGILISVLISLASNPLEKILGDRRFNKKQIEVIELIISMEEFLKKGDITVGDLNKLPKTVAYFIDCVNTTCLRNGAGSKLIKNHLYFHLSDYIKLWGKPCGWDSAYSESHHKTEIKAPSKNTQQNASTLIQQTAKRQEEKMLLRTATSEYGLGEKNDTQSQTCNPIGGSRFTIHVC